MVAVVGICFVEVVFGSLLVDFVGETVQTGWVQLGSEVEIAGSC